MLYFDRSGWCLWGKRLEAGRFIRDWRHTRGGEIDCTALELMLEAMDAEPQAAGQALEQIAALCKVEEQIRERKLTGEAKRVHRLMHSKPLVDKFFDWVDKQFERQGLLPSNPLAKALACVHVRRAGLRVFLDDSEVAIDTNHIERASARYPRVEKLALLLDRSWCQARWNLQSLIATCWLQGLDP